MITRNPDVDHHETPSSKLENIGKDLAGADLANT